MKTKWKIATGGFAGAIFGAIVGASLTAWSLGYFDFKAKPWPTDFAASVKQAASEDKVILANFTGSDWCGYCVKLTKDVFSKEEFSDGVKDDFVLVEIDYPRNKSKLSPKTTEQNEKLKVKYSVSGYPTILLLDENGTPFARTGYQKMNAVKYVSHLKELGGMRAKRDDAFAKAAKLGGIEKAKILVGTLNSMELGFELTESFYSGQIEQIKEADPADETGFIKDLKMKKAVKVFEGNLNKLLAQKKVSEAITLAEEAITNGGFKPSVQQQMISTQARLHAQLGNYPKAFENLDRAVSIMPDSPYVRTIEATRAQLEKNRLKIQSSRSGAQPEAPAPEAPSSATGS